MSRTNPREGKTWPAYILGGRMRTSTLVLIIAFLGLGWLYETYDPGPATPEQVPASEVVPPGFIPDPNYTWAPRTDVQRHSPATTTTTTTPTTPTTTSTTPTTTPTTSTSATEPSPTPTSGEPATPTPPPLPDGTPTPSPAPPPSESGAPVVSDKPAAQGPTTAVPAGGASPTPVLPTR